MENRAELKFIELNKMVWTLNDSISLIVENTDVKYNKVIKDSVIQRFEYSVELIWKFLKYYLSEEFWEEVEYPK